VNILEILGLPGLRDDLARLEECLRRSTGAEDPFLDEVAKHLVSAGGKRLRPALALAVASAAGGRASEEVLLGGVAVELVHLASLYHDDVMDEALTRRNVQTVNARWGNLVAIVAGDFLLARSAEIAASLGTEIAGLLASTLRQLCEGQVSEVSAAFDTRRAESAYLGTIAGKTASLMATSCRIGALTAGLERPAVEAVTTFGRCFGMAFQIRDDICDLIATEEELGKEPGQDLVAGIYTLPVLLALADPDAGPELRGLLGRPIGRPERDKARAIVASSGAIEATAEVGRRYAEQAAAASAGFGRNGSRDLGAALGNLGHSLIDTLPATRPA
jgi:heptaprenyl diphosphate synthase